MPTGAEEPRSQLDTTLVRGAVAGDAASLATLVAATTPLLVAQARYRLRHLPDLCEVDDLVADTWLRALPRLSSLVAFEGHFTPALLKLLATIQARRLRDLVSRRVGSREREDFERAVEVAPETAGIVTRAASSERNRVVNEAIEALGSPDRDVLVLRGIEQQPFKVVAVLAGISEAAARQRYRRARAHLAESLPESLAVDLGPD